MSGFVTFCNRGMRTPGAGDYALFHKCYAFSCQDPAQAPFCQNLFPLPPSLLYSYQPCELVHISFAFGFKIALEPHINLG